MMSYWVNFARTGAPGRGVDGGLPEWNAARSPAGGGAIMILDAASDGGIRIADDVETPERIVGDLFSDFRLATDTERCLVFRAAERWNPELVGMDGARCAGAEGVLATQ
jgi:para-nitrobenzyl esterase